MKTVARMAGRIIGSVMCQKICQRLAPSICACSNGSFGSDTMAASSVSVTSGVQCQMSMMTVVMKAAVGSEPILS